MMTKSFMAFMGVVALVTLAGCSEGPPDSRLPELTFANMQPLAVEAARVEVINNYKPPMKEPNVEHTFPLPPALAAEKLVQNQIIAAGTQHVLRALIEDASVVREKLPVETGFTDMFVREPAEKLKARVLLRFELVNENAPDIVLGHANVVATREKTLIEDISPADRDAAYFELTKALTQDLREGFNASVKNTFGRK